MTMAKPKDEVMSEAKLEDAEATTSSDVFCATAIVGKWVRSVPLFIPKHFVIVSAIGLTDVDNQTLALEAALKAAKIDHINLIKLTSALPKYPHFKLLNDIKLDIPVATLVPSIFAFTFKKIPKDGTISACLEFFHTNTCTIVIETEEPLRQPLKGLTPCGYLKTSVVTRSYSPVDIVSEFRFSNNKYDVITNMNYLCVSKPPEYIGVLSAILVLP